MDNLSFLVLSANNTGVYALAEALAESHPTHAASFYDWLNYRRIRPTWPSARATPPLLKRSRQVMPTGYAGQLEWLFRPYLQRQIQRWCHKLQKSTGSHPCVVCPYPYLAPWVRNIPAEKLVYYTYDDYVLFWADRKERILQQEAELVERASLTLCASQFQVESLKKRYPEKAERIRHYPHGVVDAYLNPMLSNPPMPMTVGYVGNLIERVDWRLAYQIVRGCPEITFVFVGGLEGGIGGQDWQVDRELVLKLPNVRHIGKVPQEQVAQYYWSFAVSWIPYDVTLPFNQACSPTKIMDSIASANPVLSTDVPECRLYPEWITIFNSAEEAIAQIRRLMTQGGTPEAREKRFRQLEFALKHTWSSRAQTLENWLCL